MGLRFCIKITEFRFGLRFFIKIKGLRFGYRVCIKNKEKIIQVLFERLNRGERIKVWFELLY